MPGTRFKVRVEGESYFSNYPEKFICTYISNDELKIWEAIIENHSSKSYLPESAAKPTIPEILKTINEYNCDDPATDCIGKITHEVNGEFIPVEGFIEHPDLPDEILIANGFQDLVDAKPVEEIIDLDEEVDLLPDMAGTENVQHPAGC